MVFGSHLYGTAGPSSDKDFKGVYLPSMNDMLLGRFPKSYNENTKQNSSEKNTSEDTDREVYSLHYFLELAKKGETVALDMLHAPKSAWVSHTWQWEVLVQHRSIFYTKNLSSLVGYARRQAAKYGVKGSRLAEAKNVLCVLRNAPTDWKISQLLPILPSGEHCGLMTAEGVTFYQVCGRKLTMNAKAAHYVPMVEKFIEDYGARAKQAETNEGVDWKAVSHAFRAAFQVRGILLDGDFTYPLLETEFLRAVKSGTLHFKNEVGPKLDTLMDEVEALSKSSTLPDAVDETKVDELLLHLLECGRSRESLVQDLLERGTLLGEANVKISDLQKDSDELNRMKKQLKNMFTGGKLFPGEEK